MKNLFVSANSTSIFPFLKNKRLLHTFEQPRNEIVIANNSGLFSSLFSLKIHGKSSHPKLEIYMPPFWLDKIHSDYEKLDWGQTIHGLPWYAREEFLAIYPNQGDKYIQWKQYKELRNSIIDKLKNHYDIPIHHGIPFITKNQKGYLIENNESVTTKPAETFFYNIFRHPEVDHPYNALPKRSHTLLYTQPKAKSPESIIELGGGRSAIWTAQHFPNSLLACLKFPNDHLPLMTNEPLPPNLIVYNLEEFTTGRFELKCSEENPNVVIIIDKKGEMNFKGEFYCAMGLKIRKDITEVVDKNNLLVFPTERLPWIAPEELPVGGLLEATLRWAAITNNLLWAHEPHCFHDNHHPNAVDILFVKMKENNIILPDNFFDCLRENTLHEAYGSRRTKIPTFKETIEIYKKSYQDASKGIVSDHAMKCLVRELKVIAHDKLRIYHSHDKLESNVTLKRKP